MNLSTVRITRLGSLIAAVAALGLMTATGPALAAPAQSLRAFGNGKEIAPAGGSVIPDCSSIATCPTGDSCGCYTLQGHGHVNVLGDATFTATIFTDLSVDAGQCFETIGQGLIVENGHPGQRIAVDFSGSTCFTGSSATPTMNAVYSIDGATSHGKWAGATGSGNISGSIGENYKVLGSIIGTIRPAN